MKERKPFLLRIDPALWAELERWAEVLLREAVRKRSGKVSSAPEPEKDGERR